MVSPWLTVWADNIGTVAERTLRLLAAALEMLFGTTFLRTLQMLLLQYEEEQPHISK